jgi:hypothetical protein
VLPGTAVVLYCGSPAVGERRSMGHIAQERGHSVSESSVAPVDSQGAVRDIESPAPEAGPRLVVITEQEVMFGTTVAVGLPRAERTRSVTATLRGLFVNSSRELRPERHHYPPRRDSFLEQAATAREMNTRWPRA